MDRSWLKGKFPLNLKNTRVLWKQLLLIFFAVIPASTSDAQQTFKLTVSDNFCLSSQGFQYRHVEISTSNGLPAVNDISIWCHAESQGNWRWHKKMVQPVRVTLKAGEVRVEKELYLPAGATTGVTSFSLTTSDRPSQRLLESPWGALGANCRNVVIVDGVGVEESLVLFNRKRRVKQPVQTPVTYKQFRGLVNKGNRIDLCSSHSKIAYLPKCWIGYSSIEQVIFTSADFAVLSQDKERFDALIQWVTMGGALLVSDCGDDFKCIPSVMRYLQDEKSDFVPKMTLYSPDQYLESECAKLSVDTMMNRLDYKIRSSAGRGITDLSSVRLSGSWTEVEDGQKFNGDTKVLLHRLGLGQITFHSAPANDKDMTQLVRACFLGLAAQRDNDALGLMNSVGDSYLKWHLLNVGVAPIGLFISVVLSFMMLIGPVGYSYLKVKQRLNYQVWLIPLISALACLLLLGYAFLSEGVGVKLRPTVFVELDQHQKVAATFARYSVYSALQPSPYRFEDDQFATLESAGDETPAVYYWGDDGYRLTGGNASARNVHQVFVATPVKTNVGIEIKKPNGAEPANSLSLTSKFNDHVKLLVVKNSGALYFVTDLAPAETKLGMHSADDEFAQSKELSKLFKGFLPTNAQSYRFNPRGRFYGRGTGLHQHEWDVGVKHIEKFRSARGIQENLEDGHYIAIFDSMKEVPSVVPGAREIDGSVIVHGKW